MKNTIYGQLTVFHTIVAQGSISAAARQLEVGAPAVSKSLKQLEVQIGLPLFNRSTRRLELTEAGQLLLMRTSDIIEALQYAVESVQDLGSKPIGHVRITVVRFVYQCLIRPHLEAFSQCYPDITLEISVNDGTVDIFEQKFDLGVRFGDKIEEGMVAQKIMPAMKEGLYVSHNYIKQYGMPKTLNALTQHCLIGYRFMTANRILPLILNNKNKEITIDMPQHFITNDIDVIADGVRKGLGIGRLFTVVHEQLPDKEAFIPVLKPYWRGYPAVYLYYLQHSQKAKRVRVLIDFLLEKANAIS